MILFVCISLVILFWVLLYVSSPNISSGLIGDEIDESISVLISFRNEEGNLPELIKALENQEGINKNKIQFVFINDHSEDNGMYILTEWQKISQYNINLIDLKEDTGKKAALRYGSRKVLNEYLIFTDADCRPNKNWLNQMSHSFKNASADLLIGTVWYTKSRNIFKRLQELEFAVLQSITAISVQMKWPFMCNGANLMTRSSLYMQYMNLEKTQNLVSGDDVFYLDFLIKHKRNICYANSSKAYVSTDGEESLVSFIQQRLRWSSKIKYYKNWRMLFPSAIFTLWSLSMVIPIVLLVWYPFWICILIGGVKLTIDYLVIKKFYKGFNRQFLRRDILTLSILYPVYILSIGVLSFFKTFTWKEREAKV